MSCKTRPVMNNQAIHPAQSTGMANPASAMRSTSPSGARVANSILIPSASSPATKNAASHRTVARQARRVRACGSMLASSVDELRRPSRTRRALPDRCSIPVRTSAGAATLSATNATAMPSSAPTTQLLAAAQANSKAQAADRPTRRPTRPPHRSRNSQRPPPSDAALSRPSSGEAPIRSCCRSEWQRSADRRGARSSTSRWLARSSPRRGDFARRC